MESSINNSIYRFDTIYYGTRNNELINNIPLDPDYNSEKIFEYGNGVYFTDNEDISRSYIMRNSIINIIKSDNLAVEDIVGLTNIKNGSLHIYNINYEMLLEDKRGHKLEVFDKNTLRKELICCIKGYRNNGIKNGYKPKGRYFTSGYLVGKEWDSFWDAFFSKASGDIKYLNDHLIEKIVDRCIKSEPNANQICIHKKYVENREIEVRYLDKRYFEYVNTISVEYIES